MSRDDGGGAFPVVRTDITGNRGNYLSETYSEGGMTLRDYFAAKALPLAWSMEQDAPTGPFSEHMQPTYAGAATRAYFMADAMLKERAK
jgi:hypothetical protein